MSEETVEARLARLERQTVEVPASRPDPIVGRLLRMLPWLMIGNIVIGVPTLVISLIVAYGTYVQAEATRNIQRAEAWPYVSYNTSNYDADGTRRISLRLSNDGVGPALMGPIELRYRGQPVATPQEFLARCCGYRAGQPVQLATAPSSRVVLRPGEALDFVALADVPANARLLPRLERERWRLRVRSCFCSIYDECWTIDGIQSKPVRVAQCPVDWVPYRESYQP